MLYTWSLRLASDSEKALLLLRFAAPPHSGWLSGTAATAWIVSHVPCGNHIPKTGNQTLPRKFGKMDLEKSWDFPESIFFYLQWFSPVPASSEVLKLIGARLSLGLNQSQFKILDRLCASMHNAHCCLGSGPLGWQNLRKPEKT